MSHDQPLMDPPTQNALAKRFASLHDPSNTLLLLNTWDPPSTLRLSTHPNIKAIATASFAMAAVRGLRDEDLSLTLNLEAVRAIALALRGTGLPLTADLQDGYADVAATVKSMVAAGAVGGNIEDVDNSSPDLPLRSVEDAVARIRTAKAAAAEVGVPDFVINARTDCLFNGGTIADAIARGKAFLEAGATTVYVWGGPVRPSPTPGGEAKARGVNREEVKELARGLGGMVNVKMNLRPGFLAFSDLRELGVARVSVGPELYHRVMEGVGGVVGSVVEGKSF